MTTQVIYTIKFTRDPEENAMLPDTQEIKDACDELAETYGCEWDIVMIEHDDRPPDPPWYTSSIPR